jgi:hypothetical protein
VANSETPQPKALGRAGVFLLLLAASWTVMTIFHELGHVIGGWCGGGVLRAVDLAPWRLPYSLFEPDPNPLLTLWSGPILGVVTPMLLAAVIRQSWIWFIANFCLLANGSYLAVAWYTGDSHLDTPKLFSHGASTLTVGLFCVVTIGVGYFTFRNSCIEVLGPAKPVKGTSLRQ